MTDPYDPPALTAGEQNHEDPWRYAGEIADPPEDCGAPGDEPVDYSGDTLTDVPWATLYALEPEVSIGARPWRNCEASMTLAAWVNARWPGRDRTSDGTIGDAAHASRDSDHNPFIIVASVGIVRARDLDVNGIDIGWLFERLRQLGAAGDPRLTGGGYLILNRRITSPDFRTWRVYSGSNPHTGHGHVSFSRNVAGFDSRGVWRLVTDVVEEFDAMANEQLANINRQLTGSDNPREYPGWETKRYNVAAQEFLTLVDIARQADRELRSNYDLSGRPSEGYDTAVGHILNIAARQVEILKRLDRIDAALAALKRP